MQHTISKPVVQSESTLRRAHRPMLMKRAQLWFIAALLLLDIGCTWLAYYLAHALLARDPQVIIGPFLEFWLLPALHAAVLVVTFFVQRMYQRRRPVSHLDEFSKLVAYNTFAILITVALLSLALSNFDPHRRLIFFAWAINTGLLIVVRTLHARVQWFAQAKGVGDDRVLLIGAGEIGQMLLQKIVQNRKLGYQVVGLVDNGKAINTQVFKEAPILGALADIPRIIEHHAIDEVIIGLPESSHQELVNIISLCEREKVGIRVFPDVFQIMASEVGIGDLGGLPLLTIRDVALRGWRLTLKRGIDVVLSAIALVLLSPFMLLAALIVKLESSGSVFYVQERMGLDARPFKILKFRSMRQDAEVVGPGWTVEDDPRRTKLGSVMRALNFDELPQLINVLVGDMSLVGPRPERPVYVEQFRQSIPRYMDRHREKAGMTGWAQIHGLRGDTSIAERTKYDLWYIENWSLALDIKIILRTLVQWITGANRNAY
jgi:exopolysaccharide biosynthesis polyprenyl glycosylphosphotransferase